ncbi:1-acyl-sn-glycerol-3-phosphate acyltransferase [Enterovibrio baiacu]|uniref:1-acyl-sn-glycerol-3-phosphate acyltransferase n=1 Tax=Enterovibrio baiacu TaxID=2491023 RepID=UPI0010112E7E|nr:1-acyl-sn-glycerol-3-phosphate acyltransferase [Enterovibrio baiacu]MBE1273377.1 1-acyl-sn-glycerol-3-phosphate acyltransferase [Enterovibrio baiacu]
MQQTNDPFSEIRPFRDDEVPGALERLVNDEEFINAILKYRFPQISGVAGWLIKPFLKHYLRSKWKKISTISDVQLHVAKYMESMIKNTSEGLSTSGLDKLDPNQSYLFVSNHRDIAMDPAMVNWCLHNNQFDTVRIAIGDNLLKKPCATELMKLNKSFIVKRSAKAPREMMKALSQLSAYIKSSLDEKQSIWIAQKEGRAKDGDDKTDPAILKMFSLEGRRQKVDFADYISQLRIVPVTISYENDPCDAAKANELFQKETAGAYEKGEFEDIESIVQGIVGQKRRIHVAFGDVIGNEFDTPETLAAEIDRQIYKNYHLFPSNYIAAGREHESVTDKERVQFDSKLSALPEGVAEIVRAMYAMPTGKKADI